MKASIILLPGDGIGPEIVTPARQVLELIGQLYQHHFELHEALIGGAAMDASDSPLPQQTLNLCRQADAVLLGAVGGPKWSDPNARVRPEQGLLALRKELGLFANLRPVQPHPSLFAASPLKAEYLENVDLLIVRELTGGIYFGEKTAGQDHASDLCSYSRHEIERVVHRAAALAQSRRGKLTLVDKANVLETSRFWRRITQKLIKQFYPELELEILLVDAAAMHLLSRPASFDVIVTENMFGDILTDEASMLAGSLGVLPSASLGSGKVGLYEPIHGSAPDIAGRNIANPIATILSTALLLRYSLGLENEARCIEKAVKRCLADGQLTSDLGGTLSTDDSAKAVLEQIHQYAGAAHAA